MAHPAATGFELRRPQKRSAEQSHGRWQLVVGHCSSTRGIDHRPPELFEPLINPSLPVTHLAIETGIKQHHKLLLLNRNLVTIRLTSSLAQSLLHRKQRPHSVCSNPHRCIECLDVDMEGASRSSTMCAFQAVPSCPFGLLAYIRFEVRRLGWVPGVSNQILGIVLEPYRAETAGYITDLCAHAPHVHLTQIHFPVCARFTWFHPSKHG